MKLFQKREYIDGGPNDRGIVIGYVRTTKTREELRSEMSHGFIDFIEISEELFLKLKKDAESKLKMFLDVL